ncbi:DUF3717 domain-containing protein [Ralstonia pseudosolanacearum]|uniref:DUF3717 domain-containing protein n=1 Tax=Ralstonia pickettii TaxID=329 RepID=A0A7X2LBZ3_RALPI|nr:DUF3717 domain-containing protein [Ralstonia pickettii]MRT01629.1 DUF3717 domain-containing protein [Ralstonia pickettii]
MTTFTIAQIEQAINYWRAAEPGGEFALNVQARALADVYGLMIYGGRAHVALTDLSAGQVEALTTALGTQ